MTPPPRFPQPVWIRGEEAGGEGGRGRGDVENRGSMPHGMIPCKTAGGRGGTCRTLNDDCVVDATRKGNKIKFTNHSTDNPTCFAKIIHSKGDHKIILYARRNIKSGNQPAPEVCLFADVVNLTFVFLFKEFCSLMFETYVHLTCWVVFYLCVSSRSVYKCKIFPLS